MIAAGTTSKPSAFAVLGPVAVPTLPTRLA